MHVSVVGWQLVLAIRMPNHVYHISGQNIHMIAANQPQSVCQIYRMLSFFFMQKQIISEKNGFVFSGI